jgi:hypothetical protein
MKKNKITLFIGLVVLMLFIPATQAALIKEEKRTGQEPIELPHVFTTCYIQADGDLSTKDWPRIIGSNMWKLSWFRPFGDDRALVSYWQLVLDSSSTIEIYDKQGGELLYEHSGSDHQQLRIIGYYGIYIPSESQNDSPIHIELEGKAIALMITNR